MICHILFGHSIEIIVIVSSVDTASDCPVVPRSKSNFGDLEIYDDESLVSLLWQRIFHRSSQSLANLDRCRGRRLFGGTCLPLCKSSGPKWTVSLVRNSLAEQRSGSSKDTGSFLSNGRATFRLDFGASVWWLALMEWMPSESV